MVGLRRLSSAGSTLPRRFSPEKYRRMSLDEPVSDSESEVESYVSAQAGVKKLEATAQLWSKWSLMVAYAGYVYQA